MLMQVAQVAGNAIACYADTSHGTPGPYCPIAWHTHHSAGVLRSTEDGVCMPNLTLFAASSLHQAVVRCRRVDRRATRALSIHSYLADVVIPVLLPCSVRARRCGLLQSSSSKDPSSVKCDDPHLPCPCSPQIQAHHVYHSLDHRHLMYVPLSVVQHGTHVVWRGSTAGRA